MRVTVCQLPDQPDLLKEVFAALVAHCQSQQSELVLLPEMPFSPWLAATDKVDPGKWQASLEAHENWLPRLEALSADYVLGSRPILEANDAYNEAFIWEKEGGVKAAHRKYYLPEEPGFWEARWYRRAERPVFQAAQAGEIKVGFMICSDLWFGEHARGYARQGIHILANPRATERASVGRWLAAGSTAAVLAGAYCLSSNHAGESDGVQWGGSAWVIDPDGKLLARSSDEEPFASVEIDLKKAEAAKHSYPRYIKE